MLLLFFIEVVKDITYIRAHIKCIGVRIQWVYLLLLLFFSEVIKDKLAGKEKPHAGKPQPAWGTWERIIKVLEFGQEYSLHLGLRASQEHHP